MWQPLRYPRQSNGKFWSLITTPRDQTLQVVEDFRSRYPGRFRYLREPNPGKSFGLNAGILASRGDILAFIDDDVTVESTWLQNLTAALQRGEWVGAGGRILLERNFSPPRWLALDGPWNMGGMLAGFDLGDKPGELQEAPYGTNMAFHKRMFEKYGLFRTDLGPSPNREVPRPNEDTEFGRRLMAAGERLYYEPSAVVHHPVPQERLKKEYFLAWWFDYGRARTREKGKGAPVWGIPTALLQYSENDRNASLDKGMAMAVDPGSAAAILPQGCGVDVSRADRRDLQACIRRSEAKDRCHARD